MKCLRKAIPKLLNARPSDRFTDVVIPAAPLQGRLGRRASSGTAGALQSVCVPAADCGGLTGRRGTLYTSSNSRRPSHLTSRHFPGGRSCRPVASWSGWEPRLARAAPKWLSAPPRQYWRACRNPAHQKKYGRLFVGQSDRQSKARGVEQSDRHENLGRTATMAL